jgi:hypothetical protein
MSTKKERPEYPTSDNYETPASATQALITWLQRHRIEPSAGILEPCAGRGAIVKELVAAWPAPRMVAIEPRDECLEVLGTRVGPGGVVIAGALPFVLDEIGIQPDLVVTNPPYGKANWLVPLLVKEFAREATVCCLMRLGWLASTKRYEFHRACHGKVLVLSNRPSFSGNGRCDGSEYCWILYGRGIAGGSWEVLPMAREDRIGRVVSG